MNDRIAHLKELKGAATPGPWKMWNSFRLARQPGMVGVGRIGPDAGGGLYTTPDGADIYGSEADFELLAALRNDALPIIEELQAEQCQAAIDMRNDAETIRMLVADVKQLRGENKALGEMYSHHTDSLREAEKEIERLKAELEGKNE